MPSRLLTVVIAMLLPLTGCVSATAGRLSASQPVPKTEVEYLAVFVEGQKIGYGKSTRIVEADKVTNRQFMRVTIGRAGISMTVQQSETSLETPDGRPLGFLSVQDMGAYRTKIEGTVSLSGQVKVTTWTGPWAATLPASTQPGAGTSMPAATQPGLVTEKTMEWPKGALMAEGLRLLTLKQGSREGTTWQAQLFMPSVLAAWQTTVVVGAMTDVDLLGRKTRLREVRTTMKSPSGEIAATSYVDDELNPQKTVVDMMGMKLEMITCGREFALSPNDAVDFFDKLLLVSPTPLKNVGSAKSAVYRLQRTGKTDLKIPSTDNQAVVAGRDGVIEVTVRPVAAARGEKFPYKGNDPAALEALKPNRFVQGDHPEVAALARKAIGDTTDAAEAGRRIEKFVRQYVNKKNLAVGYASAVEVARSREGDCTEHAVLVAAMCRSVGIPCQVVNGLGYVSQMAGRKDVFGPHAWAQAYIGGKWVGLDAALNGFDAGHITLAAGGGDPEDFFGVTQSLGMFKIVSVELKE